MSLCHHAPRSTRKRLTTDDPETILFLLLILLHLAPIWVFEYFPSQDGPSHLNNARIIQQYFNPDASLIREYFTLTHGPDPNWLGHLILAALMLLAPPLIVEKLLLSAYVILFPLSVRYAVRALRPESGFLAVLAFPFLYSFPLHMEFYYFCFSLALFFFTLGYWLRHRERFGRRQLVILAGLWLLLYFTHVVSLVMAWLALGLLALWLTGYELLGQARRRKWDPSALWRATRTRLVAPFLAFLPILLLILAFFGDKGAHRRVFTSFEERRSGLWQLESLTSFRGVELWFSRALVVLVAVAALYVAMTRLRRRQASRWDGLLLVALGFAAVYFLAPDAMSGGAYIVHRLNLFPFFALLLWLAAHLWGRWPRWGVQLTAVAIAGGILGTHLTTYAVLNRYLREYLAAAERVEAGTTLLSLSFSHRGSELEPSLWTSRIGVFRHAAGHIGAQRSVVVFPNNQANSVHFPTYFRPGLNPHRHISKWGESIEAQPPAVDFLTYPERTGGRVDYVLLWGVHGRLGNHPEVRWIFEQLEAGYERIHTSPRGLLQLYRSTGDRRDWEVEIDD